MRRLAAEERELWRRAMRDVMPLSGRPAEADRGHLASPAPPPPSSFPAPPPSPSPACGGGQDRGDAGEMPAVQSAPMPHAQPLHGRHPGVDRATAERLRRGRYPVEASLDLHGMTQDEAHRALSRFVAVSRALGRRCLLVVTGHGRSSGGILRAAVPRWLDEPALRPHLLLIAPARPQHGGYGALYLLLRRPAR